MRAPAARWASAPGFSPNRRASLPSGRSRRTVSAPDAGRSTATIRVLVLGSADGLTVEAAPSWRLPPQAVNATLAAMITAVCRTTTDILNWSEGGRLPFRPGSEERLVGKEGRFRGCPDH